MKKRNRKVNLLARKKLLSIAGIIAIAAVVISIVIVRTRPRPFVAGPADYSVSYATKYTEGDRNISVSGTNPPIVNICNKSSDYSGLILQVRSVTYEKKSAQNAIHVIVQSYGIDAFNPVKRVQQVCAQVKLKHKLPKGTYNIIIDYYQPFVPSRSIGTKVLTLTKTVSL